MTAQVSDIDDFDEEFVDELKPGTQLLHGQYTIESFLAAGGFGITYLARDSLDRVVVIKECFPGNFCRRSNASVLPRSRAHQNELSFIVKLFSQEAMSLSKAGHPNIVGVHQVFEENGTAYMALDFVEGRDLLEILTETPEQLNPENIQVYLKKIISAVGHVHKKGILHRDISPDNIIVNKDDEPVLIDFGAARENADEKASRMLSALRVVKDGYSPQEFYIAGSEQDESCDLYSLAASFYHIITGELPPDSQSRLTAFAANEPDPCVPLAKRAKGYPKAFCEALDKAMSVLPKDRMHSAEEWLSAMETGVKKQSRARVSFNPGMANVGEKKKSALPLLLGSTALVAAAGAAFFLTQGGDEVTPVTPTETANSAPAASDTQVGEETTLPWMSPSNEDTASTGGTPLPPVAEENVVEAPVQPVEPTPTPVEESVAALEPAEETPTVVEPVEPVEEVAEAAPSTTVSTTEPVVPEASATPTVPSVSEEADAPRTTVALATQPELDSGDFAVPGPLEAVPPTRSPVITDTGSLVDIFNRSAPQVPTTPPVSTATPRPQPEPEPQPEPVVVEEPQTETALDLNTASPEELERLVVDSTWSVRLPFSADPNNPGEVGEVTLNAWSWLQPGTTIIAVNGIEVDSIEKIQPILGATMPLADQEQLEITLATGRDASGDLIENAIIVPVVQKTMLGDGTQLEAIFRDNRWQTIVTSVADGSATDVQAGDILINFSATGQDVDGRTTLADTVLAAQRDGVGEVPVLVSRSGDVVNAKLVLPLLLGGNAPEAVVQPPVVEDARATEETPAAAPIQFGDPASSGIEIIESSSVVELRSADLPFNVATSGAVTVSRIDVGAPLWLASGLKILSINGEAVASKQAFDDAIQSAVDASQGDTLSLRVGVEARLSNSAIDRTLLVPVETTTALLNGLSFKTVRENGNTRVEVTAAPAGSNFQVGDTVVGYASTGEKLDGSISLKSLLDRELDAGTTSFGFVVDREGSMLVEAFQLASLSQ